MASPAFDPSANLTASPSLLDSQIGHSSTGKWGAIVFGILVVAGIAYITSHLSADLALVHSPSIFPYILLGLALFIALGFEFVNGFHDTANAVATVIYTNSLEPNVAVIYSGIANFIGVLLSSGTVAYSIVNLLPVELILRVSSGSGFAMVFALLVAAILWNLATWYKGLPASSSHTMIGSVIGVGIANQLIRGRSGVSGVDMAQVTKVFKALAWSPIIGFGAAFLLFLLFKFLARDPRLYQAPEGTAPPPLYIRILLILTCGGVSYAHGSNDGQKGMGLIMLILVGTVPTAYALNHAVGSSDIQRFAQVSTATAGALHNYEQPGVIIGDARAELDRFVADKSYQPQTMLALEQMVNDIRNEAVLYGSLGGVPTTMQANVRNDMYRVNASLTLLDKSDPKMSAADVQTLKDYRGFLDNATKFIPTWVKVAVALALGLGTMIGWKRIVVTVGEKIGKTHMTYAQGASAELITMATILGGDHIGVPVSTTHILNSSVAGTMAANGSGLQFATIRNIALAWIFTLPASALLSAGLFYVFNKLAGA